MIGKRTITAAWALSSMAILALATFGCKRAAHFHAAEPNSAGPRA